MTLVRALCRPLSLSLSLSLSLFLACSSDPSPVTVADSGTTDGSVTTDAATDAKPTSDGGSSGLVNEKASPECHDLTQRADPVTATADPGAPPTASTPLTSIEPGFYVVKEATDYGGATPIIAEATRTTIFFTATKQYYIYDDASGTKRLALEWKLENGNLVRKILCAAQGGVGTSVSYRVDASPNGFTVFVPVDARMSAYRYERVVE